MFATIWIRLRALLQRRRVARELDAELRFHLEMEIESNLARGMPPDEARTTALREFGGLTQTKEAICDVRTMSIEWVWRDARHALRSLRARPGLGLAAVAMLGIAIGITTAMFTVVDALILRPVPFHEPHQLAFLMMRSEGGGRQTVAPAVLRAWRESPAFAAAESAVPDTALLEHEGAVVTRGIARVTPGLFELLGNVQPLRGRLFTAGEGRAGEDDRVLLSEDIWRAMFGGDPALVGSRVVVDGEAVTVVGILPSDFCFPAWNTVIWRPIDFEALSAARSNDRPAVFVRFAPNVPRAEGLRRATDAARAADATNRPLWAWDRPLAGMVLDAYYQRALPLLGRRGDPRVPRALRQREQPAARASDGKAARVQHVFGAQVRRAGDCCARRSWRAPFSAAWACSPASASGGRSSRSGVHSFPTHSCCARSTR